MLVRFSLFNSALAFLAAFGWWYADLGRLLWQRDVSHMSVLIIAVYLAATAYLGFARERASRETLTWISEGLTTLGLIGTVIAFLMAGNAGSDNEATTAAILSLFVTTLSGLVTAMLLQAQVRFVIG
jgi:hypothetical protein